MLDIWVEIRYNQKDCHAHDQVAGQLVIFVFIFVDKDEEHHCSDDVKEPEQIRNYEKLAERDHVIENGMDHMIAMYRSRLQIVEENQIKDAIADHQKSVTVLFKKAVQDYTFLKIYE